MPYQRSNLIGGGAAPNQPGHYDVGSQDVSCLIYENFNADYKRANLEGGGESPDQPKILQGWNEDFVRVKVDGTKITGLSQQMVLQTLYDAKDVDNLDNANAKCYKPPRLFPTKFAPDVIITAEEFGEDIFITSEQFAPYYLESDATDRPRLVLEPNTEFLPGDLV